MKLTPEVLAELIDIFRQAIVEQVDVSDRLRNLDLEPSSDNVQSLVFTDDWLRKYRGSN